MTPLKQCDPRWGSKKLGNSTLCKIGCTCTCVAMLSDTTPDKIVDQADFTSYGAILWQSLSKANIKFHWRGYNYENDKVAEAIENYGGCLVEVSMPQATGGKHWVLFIGNKQMADPITGKLEATSKYTPTGYCILEPLQTNNNTMSDALQECLLQHTQLVDELTKLKEEFVNLEDKLAYSEIKLKEVDNKLLDANKKRIELESDLAEKKEELGKLVDTLASERKDFEEAEKKHKIMTDELIAHINKLENEQIDESELVITFLDKVIEGLDGYSGEKTIEGVKNSISQREAQRLGYKQELETLKANPIIKFILIIKGLIK